MEQLGPTSLPPPSNFMILRLRFPNLRTLLVQTLLVSSKAIRRDKVIVIQSFQQRYLELAIYSIGKDLLVIRDEELKARSAC